MTDYPNFFEVTARPIFEELLLRPQTLMGINGPVTHEPRPLHRILQLGVFTGDASVWLMENVKPDLLVDVDGWKGSTDEKWTAQYDWADIEAVYDTRTAPWRDSIDKQKCDTLDYLTCAIAADIDLFDMIYVDADHTARATLEHAVLGYHLLNIGGILVFDDYTWTSTSGRLLDQPMPAIDAFKYLYADRMRFICTGSQLWLEKFR